MSAVDLLGTAAAGMDAERHALDLAARNVAASQADGPTFSRLLPRFALGSAPSDADTPDAYDPGESVDDGADSDETPALPIRYLGATTQRGVDVDAVGEMVAVLDAQRAFEANASVFDLAKRLAERTIDMGRLQ